MDQDLRQGPGLGQGSLLHHARLRPGRRPAADAGDRRLSDGQRRAPHRALPAAGRSVAASGLPSGDRQGRADRRQVRDLLPQWLLRRGRPQQQDGRRAEEGAGRQRHRPQSGERRSDLQSADEGFRRRLRRRAGRSEGARAAESGVAEAARAAGAALSARSSNSSSSRPARRRPRPQRRPRRRRPPSRPTSACAARRPARSAAKRRNFKRSAEAQQAISLLRKRYSPLSVRTNISSTCGWRTGSPDSSGSRFCSET